jgi:glycosyltransferase involved in cell wall biosynthesis
MLIDKSVEFIGEVDDRAKQSFLGNATALLFPIDWPEPFGLVMIEAMACGTPVIAWRRGSVPEIVEDGVSGFVVESEAEAVEAIHRVRDLDWPGGCPPGSCAECRRRISLLGAPGRQK